MRRGGQVTMLASASRAAMVAAPLRRGSSRLGSLGLVLAAGRPPGASTTLPLNPGALEHVDSARRLASGGGYRLAIKGYDGRPVPPDTGGVAAARLEPGQGVGSLV